MSERRFISWTVVALSVQRGHCACGLQDERRRKAGKSNQQNGDLPERDASGTREGRSGSGSGPGGHGPPGSPAPGSQTGVQGVQCGGRRCGRTGQGRLASGPTEMQERVAGLRRYLGAGDGTGLQSGVAGRSRGATRDRPRNYDRLRDAARELRAAYDPFVRAIAGYRESVVARSDARGGGSHETGIRECARNRRYPPGED